VPVHLADHRAGPPHARDAYPDSFKMTAADIEHAPEVPSIAPLLPKT
jgi:hypothetical protein